MIYIVIILAVIIVGRLMWDAAGWLMKKLDGVTIRTEVEDEPNI